MTTLQLPPIEHEGSAEKSAVQPIPVFLMLDSFETGGTERQFAMLAKAMDRSRFTVSIGCLQKKGAFLKDPDEVREFSLGGNLYGPRSMQARWQLARHLRQAGTLVVHAFDFYSNLVLIPAARLAKIPVVIGSQRQMGDLLSLARSRAQATALRWADAVVCNSRAAKQALIDQGLKEERIAVIGNGLPPSMFEAATPALGRDSSCLRVGMIARMNTLAKRHDLFLRAAAGVCRTFKEMEIVFVGDGPFRPEFEKLSSDLSIRDRVSFLGERHDIPSLLASMDVIVAPSDSESLSNAILESMAAGVPVIASRVGGNCEVIGEDRGILVAAGDEKGLSEAIDRLLRDSSLRGRVAGNAKRFAKANYSIEHMREQYQELYTRLVSERANTRARYLIPKSPMSIRVAIVAASPRYVGGQSVQADALLSRWRNDPAIKASLIPIDPSIPRILRWVMRVPLVRTVVRQPFYLAALWRGLKNVDVAHIFSASYSSFWIAAAPARLMARFLGKPSLIHYHSGEAEDHLGRSALARRVLGNSDGLIVPSRYLVDVFRKFGLSAQTVPNVIDLQQFPFRVRRPLRPHLICTRGFHNYYRVDLVVRAFAEVQQEFPDARLDLLGGGSTEARVRELVNGLRPRGVNFAGVIGHHEIASFYDAADIFINASYIDNMPVSILEAFACGTPVVSTCPESLKYMVEHERTGLLSEVDDFHMLARNVIRLLKDPDLSDCIARNAYGECERYTWDAVRDRWIQVYRGLARSDGVGKVH
jgi:glycosyltransferase involved in cell wall biosynthesis